MANEKQHQKGNQGGDNNPTLRIPESLGGTGEIVQFSSESFRLINDYLMSVGHEVLSTGTEEQQKAIEEWAGLTPSRAEVAAS